jgi:hypothetical protein
MNDIGTNVGNGSGISGSANAEAASEGGPAGGDPVLSQDVVAELFDPGHAPAYGDQLVAEAASQHTGDAPVLHGAEAGGSALDGHAVVAGDAAADVGDLHAALASLATDSLSSLDLALDHLTSSADLFDLPAIDFGDVSHE